MLHVLKYSGKLLHLKHSFGCSIVQLDSWINHTFDTKKPAERIAETLQSEWAKVARADFSISLNDLMAVVDAQAAARATLDEYFSCIMTQSRERRANLAMFAGNVQVVSLGEDCFSRTVATQWGLKPFSKLGERSHPFDLAVHPLHVVEALITKEFREHTNPADIEFRSDLDICINRRLGIMYNHEKGIKYADDNFRLLQETYARRARNFFEDIDASPRIAFFAHIARPQDPENPAARQLWHTLKSRWPQKRMVLCCVQTWPKGSELDPALGCLDTSDGLRIFNICYPKDGYIWYEPKFCFTPSGFDFEQRVVASLREQMTGLTSGA